MTQLLAFLWTPVIMALLAVGIGLSVERVTRTPLPSALLAPVGGAVAIVLTTAVYRAHGTALPAAIVVGVVAIAGLVVERRALRERLRPGWAGAAALAAYVLFIGPTLLTGHWTWAGYNFVNDTSVNLLYIDLLAHHGYTGVGVDSTTTRMQTFGVAQRYPMGVHGLIATLGPFTGIDAAARYQPFIATCAAGSAAALTHIARRAAAPGPAAALIGALAAGANLTYQYAQQGAIKEIAVVMLVAVTAAVVAEVAARGLTAGAGAVLALCLTPIVLVLSAGGAPYALIGALFAVVALLAGPRRPTLRKLAAAAGVGILATVLAGAIVADDVLSYARGPGSSFKAPTGEAASITPATFGQLVRALPPWQAAGIWFGQDYRFPLAPGPTRTLQVAITALIALLAVAGLVVQIVRRRPGAPVLLAICGLTALLVSPRLEPYADAKLLTILSPAIVLCAGLGLCALWAGRRRVMRIAAVVLAVGVGGAVLYSDALAAHETRFAPPDRMSALEDAAEHAGGGYWLINEWEEFGKYFARSIRTSTGSESESPDVVELRENRPIFGFYFDLDQQQLGYIEKFDGIIMRRSPDASRPPADYDRVYSNDYYELWRREGPQRVREHLPLGLLTDPTARPRCGEVRRMAGEARRLGGVLVANERREVPVLQTVEAPNLPGGWRAVPGRPRNLALTTPGKLADGIEVREAGPYRVWLQLSTGRPMEVRLDGRSLGSRHQVNSPDQWLDYGRLELSAGTHDVELIRGGGRPLPGDGYEGEVGALALEPLAQAPGLVTVAPADAERRLCGRQWDWIEVVER